MASAGSSEVCPSSVQTSCLNTTKVTDLCCFNAPGGQLLQTQFWDTSPEAGPVNSWTVHGLWPDHCDGTYDANCDTKRAYTNITEILQGFGKTDLLAYMDTYWPDYEGDNESFWEHEWGKHGTCISTLKPSCYTNYVPTQEVPDFFQRTVDIFKTLPSYQWLAAAGITPSSTKTYTSAQIQAALKAQHGYEVTLGCSSSALDEIWYDFNVKGSVQDGTFLPAAPLGSSTCPSTGIKYLPKSSGSTVTYTSTPQTSTKTSTLQTTTKTGTTTAATATSTGAALSGTGYLNVVVKSSGDQTGCLISAGTWYSSGTCATFTATASGSTFTLKSSKGYCGVSGSTFSCSSSFTASSATAFTVNGAELANGGSVTWSAPAVASGSTQETVSSASGSVSLLIEWQSL